MSFTFTDVLQKQVFERTMPFQKNEKNDPRLRRGGRSAADFLLSVSRGENVVVARCERGVRAEVGGRPWETHGVIVALIHSMPLNSCSNASGCFTSPVHLLDVLASDIEHLLS